MKPTILNYLIASPLIFSSIFLAIRTISVYILPRYQKTNKLEKNTMNQQTKLAKLIQQSKGKFFSVQFIKKDGTKRTANGKDFYLRLLVSQDGAKAVFSPRENPSVTPFIDRNKEGWISASDERLVHFKCGKLEVNF